MTTDPISAVLEGVLLGSEELGGRHPWKASAEDIINACAHLVDEYGIKLERQGKACSDSSSRLEGMTHSSAHRLRMTREIQQS